MPAPRRLLTFPGVPRLADEPKPTPATPRPKPVPAAPEPEHEPEPEPEPKKPGRRTPTPAEIWPPHRRDRKPDQARSA